MQLKNIKKVIIKVPTVNYLHLHLFIFNVYDKLSNKLIE